MAQNEQSKTSETPDAISAEEFRSGIADILVDVVNNKKPAIISLNGEVVARMLPFDETTKIDGDPIDLGEKEIRGTISDVFHKVVDDGEIILVRRHGTPIATIEQYDGVDD